MERLTIEYCGLYVPKGLCSIDRLSGADDCDLCCEYCKATEEGDGDCEDCAISHCFNKLGEYEDLEEQGKLLKLPCAVGDTVYEVQAIRKRIQPYEILAIKIGRMGEVYYYWKLKDDCGVYGNLKGFGDKRLGKDVFLTKSEAEAALQKMKEMGGGRNMRENYTGQKQQRRKVANSTEYGLVEI